MGKKRVTQLLNQLKDNQQQDIENAASIFTVAQIAVDTLDQQLPDSAKSPNQSQKLPSAQPAKLDKAALMKRYGSYRNCRKAAKEKGIKFRKTPTWAHLAIGFQRAEEIEELVAQSLKQPQTSQFDQISITIDLSKLGTLKLPSSGVASEIPGDSD